MEQRDELFSDLINEWHISNSTLKLSEYLGLTDDEYKKYIRSK